MKYIIIFLLISCKVTAQPPSLSSFTSLTQQNQLKLYVKYEVDSVGAILQKNFYYQLYLRDKKIDSLVARIKKMEDSAFSITVDSSIKYVQGSVLNINARSINLAPIQQQLDLLKQYMILQKLKFIELTK